MNIVTGRAFDRRTFLRGTGVALALPLLDAMRPALVAEEPEVPRRMMCVCSNMGMMPEFFWPEGTGRDYRASEYLQAIERHRERFTVFGGVSHPDVDGGHHAEVSYLTAAPHPSAGGFRNGISLDQYAAEWIGTRTRFGSLSLLVGHEHNSLSWNAAGVRIPAENSPAALFRRLFVRGDAAEVREQVRRLRDGRSVLDVVAGRAAGLRRRVGGEDRHKLDQYFGSVRELEQRLVESEAWQHRPKPQVDAAPPTDVEDRTALIERTRLMFRMAKLALETDSTRIVALAIDQNANPKVDLPGVTQGHHSLTHHGRREDTVRQLRTIESAQMAVLGELLDDLHGVGEDGATLLDRTMVLYGSNLGNANSHDNRNLPMILAGGGFRHVGHLTFDRQRNEPLPNLYVSMLQRLGIETDRFASSTGTLRGLELS